VVEPQTSDHLKIAGDLDLVLDIRRGQIRLQMIVRVTGALAECDGRLGRGVEIRNRNRGRGVVEVAGVTNIIRELATDLCASQYRVTDTPCRSAVYQVGLV